MQWLWTYNNERPNMGICGITPAMDFELKYDLALGQTLPKC